ncbi:lytic transglycosylase domain-containing protein [Bradyrhizobium sp. UFLA05-153]
MPISLRPVAPLPFGRSRHRSSIPANSLKPSAYTRASERRRGRYFCAMCWAAATVATRLTSLTFVVGLIAALLTVESTSQATGESLPAVPSLKILPIVQYAPFVSKASRRFAIPEHWIRTVVKVESGGNAQAVSPRGALGLMQIMPSTWIELSVRYELGLDPFDPRDNILAGAAYLRKMLDRFGSEGFLAAYNVGPGRYEQFLATGRRLPKEALTYVRAIESEIGIGRDGSLTSLSGRSASRLQDVAAVSPPTSSFVGSGLAAVSALIPRATGLFVQSSNAGSSR